MRKRLFLLLAPFLLVACGDTATDTSQFVQLDLRGDMLFAGANTLQMPASIDARNLAEALSISVENLKKVGVKKAVLSVDPSKVKNLESFLLQVVSNEQDLITIGTLSPIKSGGSVELQLAEEVDLLPFLKDEGCTWVLDLNLAEDHMDEMQIDGNLYLQIEYIEKN